MKNWGKTGNFPFLKPQIGTDETQITFMLGVNVEPSIIPPTTKE
jgi:hypothetical protein